MSMTINSKDIVKKLDSLSFNSLNSLGIDWRSILKTNPELQQEYDQFLTLRKDWIIVNVDYSQLELYVLASISGDKNMISTVNSGKDIHSENTKKMYNIEYEKLERDFKKATPGTDNYNELETKLKDFKAKRKSTKALSFSLSYGAGAEKISMDNRITIKEAQKLIDDFYKIYPGAKLWQEQVFLNAIKSGYIETPWGRRRATPKIHNRMDAYRALVDCDSSSISKLKKAGEYWSLRNEFKTCKNTPIQSVASDMCSLAACKFKEYLKTANKRAEMYFWIHDSIVFAAHIDDTVELIERLMSIMENEVKYDGDPVNYRAALDLGYNYEWTVEVKREDWINNTNKKEFILEKLNEALDLDKNKKFKMIIKSTSEDLSNFEAYIKKVKLSKEQYFEKLVEGLGIEGVHSPEDYILQMNGVTKDEYEQAMGFDEETDGEDEED